jgi:hypothetical protein
VCIDGSIQSSYLLVEIKIDGTVSINLDEACEDDLQPVSEDDLRAGDNNELVYKGEIFLYEDDDLFQPDVAVEYQCHSPQASNYNVTLVVKSVEGVRLISMHLYDLQRDSIIDLEEQFFVEQATQSLLQYRSERMSLQLYNDSPAGKTEPTYQQFVFWLSKETGARDVIETDIVCELLDERLQTDLNSQAAL